jgi:iron complex outermembrane receptor protein/hemoglobin/transferrin/lactoferrin receptor protein
MRAFFISLLIGLFSADISATSAFSAFSAFSADVPASSASSAFSADISAFSAFSADAFEGRVVDANGNPIAGAEITILGRAGESRTNADGRFTWVPDPPAPFEVLVIAPGGVYMKPILVERIGDGVVEIVATPLVNEHVTVSGSAASIETSPGAGTATLTATEIQTRTPANLVQALENVAGVNQVSEGQAGVPAVRGLARGRTLILIDGARVSSERRVGPSATYLDPDVIEGVEIARGPGSVAYGSDAFGGVISVRTRTVAPLSPFAARVSGTLGAGIPDRRVSAEVSQGFARGGVLVAAHTRDVGDYDAPGGEIFNSGYSDRGFLGRVTYQIGQGLFSAGWQSDFGRDIERPRNNSRTVRFVYPTEDSHRLTVSYDARDLGAFSRVMLTGFAGSYAQVTDQDRFATATTGRSVERADVSAKDFHVRGFGERLLGVARIELGVDINGRYGLRALDIFESYALDTTLAQRTENVSVDSARRVDTGVYASVEAAPVPMLSIAGGVRGDYVTTRNRGGFFGDRSTGNGAGSGFVALTAGSWGGFSTTLQIARGFRDPVLSDRYFRGPSGRGFITGNPDLEPETSLQLDLGLRYTSPRLRAATYFYNYRISDLIERFQAETDFFFFRNRGRARLRGFEAEAQASLGWGLSLESAFQVARGRALDDDTYLDDIAPETFSLQLRRAIRVRGSFVQLRAAWYAEDTRPGPTEIVVPGYTLLDAAGGVSVVEGLELRLSARNLLNDEYMASQDVRTVLAPGRSVALTAVVRLGPRP